jgi:glycosyltransferase involved in cell wall biosynthesis
VGGPPIQFKVAFLGGARYSKPLDTASEKKFCLLTRLGRIFVIGFSEDVWPRLFRQHARFYLLPQLPVGGLRYVSMFLLGLPVAMWLIICHGIQVLVAQSPYEGCVATVATKLGGWFGREVALIVESHGDFEVSLFLQRRVRFPNLYRMLMRQAARFSLRHADVLRAISTSTRAQLERAAPDKPMLEFPTWTDMEVFFAAGGSRQKYGDQVVYAGVLITRKGVHVLLEAFAKVNREMPTARLLLIGKPEDRRYAQSLRDGVERLGLNGVVTFQHHQPQLELSRRIAEAQVFVLPSLSEGLGRVVVEAMACGTPVIGSRVGGIPQLIEDSVTGFLVPPGDVDALADRIRWMLSHREDAQDMGRQARESARTFFSSDAYMHSYARLFEMAILATRK